MKIINMSPYMDTSHNSAHSSGREDTNFIDSDVASTSSSDSMYSNGEHSTGPSLVPVERMLTNSADITTSPAVGAPL